MIIQTLPSPFLYFHLLPTDCSDGTGGGGGVLPLLVASPHCPSVGGVRDLPTNPSLVCVAGGRPLFGLQQLLCQPGHLRLPVGELQESLQTGVQVPNWHH